jgi:glycosyltransferase involved in cell wall biosynthesis
MSHGLQHHFRDRLIRDDRLKILFHHRIASRDGQAVHLEELIDALRALGHEVVLVGPDLQATRFGGGLGLVQWIKDTLPASLYELIEIAYNLPAFIRLVRAVRANRPDVIYERFSLFLLAGIWVRRLCGVPILLEVNGPLFEERVKNDGLALHRIAKYCQGHIWNEVDFVLPVTEVLAAIVRSYGVRSDHIAVIPNGINPARFAIVPDPGTAKAALSLRAGLVLGFTGFARRWHGLERVIDFIADHGDRFDLYFLLVGDGPVREELLAYARERNVADRFRVTGVVERDDVSRYVAAFDIALQPGITAYASPLKLFEYMYMGRAIVAPASDNIREILTDSHDAVLFDPAKAAALESALLRLCSGPELRARLGRQAHQTIIEKSLTWRANAERVVRLSETLVTGIAASSGRQGAAPTPRW